MDYTKFYKQQISLSEWLSQMSHSTSKQFLQEDSAKKERLMKLNHSIGLPVELPMRSFQLESIMRGDVEVTEFISEYGQNLCALRLIPNDSSLAKLRIRGVTIKKAIEVWLPTQEIQQSQYRSYKCDIIPHPQTTVMSSIFVVGKHGIAGEVIEGDHHQLTQGFYEQAPPIEFSFNFDKITFRSNEHSRIPDLEKKILNLINMIKVDAASNRESLRTLLDCSFVHNFIEGYFETIETLDYGVWFIDYNRFLGLSPNFFEGTFSITEQKGPVLSGRVASEGSAFGKVVVVGNDLTDPIKFNKGDILVCKMTNPSHLSMMQKASGIITEQGGILSHASIVCRELKVPCLVGVKNATTILQTGMIINLDASSNKITIIDTNDNSTK